MALALDMFCILVFIISLTPSQAIINGEDVIRLEKNGKVTYLTEFSYLVLLEMKASINEKVIIWNCGGVIIKPDVILTAAHCLAACKNKPEISAWAGIGHRELEKNHGQKILAAGYKVHEEFGGAEDPEHPTYLLNDIAIIWLEKTYTLGKRIQIANLPKRKYDFIRKTGVIPGWGYTERCEISSVLKKVQLFVISDESCQNFYHTHSFTGKTFCAMSENRKSGVSEGDSGGPFVFKGIVVGISSFTGITKQNVNGVEMFVSNPKIAAVFTDVFEYRDWITNNLKSRTTRKVKLEFCGLHQKAICRNNMPSSSTYQTVPDKKQKSSKPKCRKGSTSCSIS